MYRTKHAGRGRGLPCPRWTCHFWSTSMCSPLKLSIPCPFWVFMEASLHRYNWLNAVATGDWFNFQHLSPARRKKEGCNFQLCNHVVCSSGNQALSYGNASFCGTHLCIAEYLAHLIFGCVCVCLCVCVLRCSVMSSSLWYYGL